MATVINRNTKQYLMSVHTPDYPALDWIHNPIIPLCALKYWKIVGDEVLEMSQAEKEAIDLAEQQAYELYLENLKDLTNLNAIENYDKLVKAFALLTLDQINNIREWLENFKIEVSQSTSLADFKTRVASLSAMPSFSVEQFRNAIKNKYNEI